MQLRKPNKIGKPNKPPSPKHFKNIFKENMKCHASPGIMNHVRTHSLSPFTFKMCGVSIIQKKNETSILSVVKTYISFRNIKPFTTCFIANTHFYTQKFLFEAINCCKNVYAPYAHYAVTEDTEISFSMMKHDTQTRNPTTLCLQIDLFTEPL